MCGIFGIIREKPKKFDYSTFCTLGVWNDHRGGDSCGIFIDGKYEYGTGPNKYFESFMIPDEGGSKLLQETKTAAIAIGHCRKASVGKIEESTAQPVIIKEDDEIKFVVMHNGTIHNYKELAKKYIPEIDIKDMTDSQVMARIFYYQGYDVLDEYYGGATFFILDYRNNKTFPQVLCFRGCSKKFSYSTTKEEERGVWFAISDGELVFSSEQKFLNTLRPNAYQCYPLDNLLVEWTGTELIINREFTRDKVTQSPPPVSTVTPFRGQSAARVPAVSTPSTNRTYDFHEHLGGSTGSSPFVSIDMLTGRCRRGDIFLHGLCQMSSLGRFKDSDVFGNKPEFNDYWFWAGYLLKNQSCYTFLAKMAKDCDMTPTDIYNCYPELVLFLSPYPFFKNNAGMMMKVNAALSSEPYTGNMFYPFNSNEYTYTNGLYTATNIKSMNESLTEYRKHCNDTIDFTEFIDQK